MASISKEDANLMSDRMVNAVKSLVWGPDIKHDVFRRWSQGFDMSEDECTAFEQHEGGPCAVIVPVQAYFLRSLMFPGSHGSRSNWRSISGEDRDSIFVDALMTMFKMLVSPTVCKYFIVSQNVHHEENGKVPTKDGENSSQNDAEESSSPKKQCFSHEQFHSSLKCTECNSIEILRDQITQNIEAFQNQYGVLLLLYSLILTKGVEQIKKEVEDPIEALIDGVEQIKNEVEDPSEALIDGLHGHGAQSLINLLTTGTAVSNVWDNDKDISGLKLHGISQRSTIGFLTLLEHLRYLEVGWNLKNPESPIWLLGSETHLTVLFSEDRNLVCAESPEAAARRVFNDYDKEGSGFIIAEVLGDLMAALDLVAEPEYVKIMKDKLDPERLGIVTLNSFMEEFFPIDHSPDAVKRFKVYHYNGLKRSCHKNKVTYQEGIATIMETPELQIITDSSPIKTCLMTKWPTIEMAWTENVIPSLN